MRRLVIATSAALMSIGLLAGCSASVSVGDASPSQAPASGGAVSLTKTLVNEQFGFSFGYGEKFGKAVDASGAPAGESAGIRLVPLNAVAVYRFDWAADVLRIPLVPFVAAGFVR